MNTSTTKRHDKPNDLREHILAVLRTNGPQITNAVCLKHLKGDHIVKRSKIYFRSPENLPSTITESITEEQTQTQSQLDASTSADTPPEVVQLYHGAGEWLGLAEGVAHRLVEHEASAVAPDIHSSAAFRCCEKFRQPLARLAGAAAFRSLLSRALSLTKAEAHWLEAVHVAANGSLEGLGAATAQLTQKKISEGEVLLVAHLIGLLITFVGEEFTLQLVLEAWPDATFDSTIFEDK